MIMNKTLKIVLTSIGATLVCAYVVGAIVFFPDHKQEQVCQRLEINISDSDKRQFLSDKDLRKMLKGKGLMPENKPFNEIETQALEDAAMNVEVLREAECYKTNSGTVSLNVRQREPRLRVIGAENYYVDSERKIMPASYKTACRVPVVTGRLTHEMAQTEIYDFALWLDDHSFWSAQIEQINVLDNKEVELIPRVGGHVILLGQLVDYEQKLEKLQVFYDEGFSKVGWLPYREVDLRYKGQVVGRK